MWQCDSIRSRLFCMICKKTFELTEVNVWYKGTALEGDNVEYTGA